MEVQSTPAFPEYVSKSVKQYVNIAISHSMDALIDRANNSGR